MEVHFSPDVQAKLDRMARESGRPSGELVEDAVIGYFAELAHTREMLDRRYDDLESGQSEAIGGEAFFESLRRREDELLKKPAAMSDDPGFALHPLAGQDITDVCLVRSSFTQLA